MESWLERGGIGVLFALGMTMGVVLFLFLTSGVSAEAFAFRDVVGQPWYRSSLDHMSQIEVVRGYEDGTFKPDQYVNRAEMVTLLSRYHAYLLTEYFPQHSSSDSRFLDSMLSADIPTDTTANPEQKKISAVASGFVDHQLFLQNGSELPNQQATEKVSSCAN